VTSTLTGRAGRPPINAMMAMLALTLLAACSGQMRFPVTEAGQESLASRNINVIPVTTENVTRYSDASWLTLNGDTPANPPRDPSTYTYRVDSGDQLRVQTWTTPERTTSGEESTISEGPIVNETGEFFYPFVGQMPARGRTVSEIRNALEHRLQEYISEPQVEVAVQEFNAHRATITGAVANPSSTTLTNVPLRLLEFVNTAGANEQSDLRHVVIRRRGREYRVNLRAYMEEGRQGHNPIILPGDVVYVPPIADNKVFTFGEIGVGEIRLGPERMTLTEVLAAQGGIDQMRADARGVFVFRQTSETPNGFDVFQFNLRDASALVLTSQFAVAPMDIVYVTSDPITQWNDTVGKLISPLTGFVQARNVSDEFTE